MSTVPHSIDSGDRSGADPASGPATRLVDLAAIEHARELLRDVVRVTPVLASRVLSERVGGPVQLKCENLQRTGSFKLRGAYVRIAGLSAAERAGGVVAASAGNHAQGVALAAQLLGTAATVFMPTGAPLPKIAATRGYGAEVRLIGSTLAETFAAATEHAAATGATYVHPFDHPDLLAGQGTVGLEILDQCPDVRTVVVPAGGGGLLSGVAAAIRARRPDVRLIGVQAEGAAALPPSLAAGHPVTLRSVTTIADGIAVPHPAELTVAHVAALVDEVVTVEDEALSRALLLCLERAKLVVEPAGVAAVAALLTHPEVVEPPVVAVLSGGNIDPLLLLHLIQHGMVAANRYLSLRLRIPDRPGALAALLGLLAEQGANVLDVEHFRVGHHLHLGEVEVALSLEAKGDEHSAALLACLAHAGYRQI